MTKLRSPVCSLSHSPGVAARHAQMLGKLEALIVAYEEIFPRRGERNVAEIRIVRRCYSNGVSDLLAIYAYAHTHTCMYIRPFRSASRLTIQPINRDSA